MDYNEKINQLAAQLTGDFLKDMEIRDQIHNLKMERDGVKPRNTEINCVGCSG